MLWLFGGYPVWWALGLGQFAFWIFAVPMAADLVRRHRTVGLRLPPGFWLWGLFLVWSVAGLALIGLTPPGTLPGSGGPAGALMRLLTYLALTVLLLYIGNTPGRPASSASARPCGIQEGPGLPAEPGAHSPPALLPLVAGGGDSGRASAASSPSAVSSSGTVTATAPEPFAHAHPAPDDDRDPAYAAEPGTAHPLREDPTVACGGVRGRAPGDARHRPWAVPGPGASDGVPSGSAVRGTGRPSARVLADLDVARALGVLCLATIGGGFLGLVAPTFEFTSPVEMLLPAGVAADAYVQALVHPASAQIMDVLGYESARPKAPWEYTNTWGNMLSLLLVWLAVAWIARGGMATRCAAVAAVAAAAVPVVHSLNRALWVGLALSVAFLLVCLLRRGRVAAVAICGGGLAVLAAAALLSPLATVVQERVGHPHSDDGRAAASIAAVEAANASPVLGWGSTRDMLGSSASIAVGSSPECPGCGNHTIGNNGQLQLTLIANGWVGTALFVAFFAQIAWRFRRDSAPVGAACLLTVLLLFWYMSFYVALAGPLAVSMVAVALLWRRAAEGRSPVAVAGGAA
ncbi:hypothetical protein ACFO4E_08900 [Nocardiopsis mangrovi]|uniref:Ligase n=1 Tax=Nocardiopsis mangrovi TaxID=1179818 RepID=A0ABV9DT97_9ACTN